MAVLKKINNKNAFIKGKGMPYFFALLGGTLFYAHELNIAVFVRIFTFFGIENSLAVLITSFIPFLLSLPLLKKKYKKVNFFLIIYVIVFLYFIISVLLNLENLQYYFIPKYGVIKVFIPSGGIFAIYYITLLYDKDEDSLLTLFTLVAFSIFTIGILQYIAAQSRGYWIIESMKGVSLKSSYNLNFGFNMAFAVNLFIGLSIMKNRLYNYFLIVIGFYMIITAGSRMSLFLPFFLLLLLLLYFLLEKIKRRVNNKDIIKVVTIFLMLMTTFLGSYTLRKNHIEKYNKSQQIEKKDNNKSQQIEKKDKSRNFQTEKGISRNLDMLRSGYIFINNGRKDIHKLVLDGIKKHPIIGLGAFGDRPLIAPIYKWGYSHGIHYEIWSNFGLILGIPLILYLANTFFSMIFKNKNNFIIIFLVLVATAALHLTSLSFWFEPFIWTTMAISFLHLEKKDYWINKILKRKLDGKTRE